MSRKERLAMLFVALAIDRYAGEPPERFHPVVWMGRVISLFDNRAPSGPRKELAYGTLSVAVATLVPALAASLGLKMLRPLPLRLLAGAWLLKSCFAYHALEKVGLSVADPLARDDLPAARDALIALVSRDRSKLDAPLVAAAAIESLAENLSDSFAAPLLAYTGGGLPAAVFYRAANTADAMIGYHGRYEYLGKAAARLDDALNLLPARLTALTLVATSGSRAGQSWKAALRDHGKARSPNAGWPMAAAAGSLGVALCKPGHYELNEGAREPDAEDLFRAIGLCRRAAVLCLGLAVATIVAGRAGT